MRKLILASAFFLGSVGIASSADIPAPASYTWTGGYIGAQVGGLWGTGNPDIPNYDFSVPDIDTSGWMLGGYAGYHYQLDDNFVIGAEISGNWTDSDGSESTGQDFTEDYNLEQDWSGSGVLHLGYAMDQFMIYGLGGVAVTEMTGHYSDPSGSSSDESDTVWGWTIGAGAEVAITENWHARVEYRYADYSTADLECSDCGPTDMDLSTNSVTIGMSYNFY